MDKRGERRTVETLSGRKRKSQSNGGRKKRKTGEQKD